MPLTVCDSPIEVILIVNHSLLVNISGLIEAKLIKIPDQESEMAVLSRQDDSPSRTRFSGSLWVSGCLM